MLCHFMQGSIKLGKISAISAEERLIVHISMISTISASPCPRNSYFP